MAIEGDGNNHDSIINGVHKVNFDNPRKFGKRFKANAKETLFPDDPFHQFKGQPFFKKALIGLQYFVPIAEWLPKYNFKLFRYDLLAGITIASLAIPQGISYAKLASIPPIIGLYSSFVPPLVYAVFGSSKKLAVGTVAAGSLLIHEVIEQKVHVKDNPTLHLHLVFTAAFFSGVFQFLLGVFRLGILVDFLSHSTITGFMGGTAVIICLQQLKGMLGLQHFTTKTDVVSVFKAIFKYRNEWQWEPAVIGVAFLIFLQITRFIRSKNPKLFWVSAIAPMVTVVIGCLFAYFSHADKHHIAIVGDLKKGLNPLSISDLNFDSQYLMLPLQAGIISAVLALAEGIAIGRSFAQKNEQTDGNKEMIAFGLMNIVGSCTSCYLTTGPFSKTAVNYNAGAKTQMSNVVMSICLMLTLLFLAPAFSYTPLVALSAIIMSAMFGLIKYNEAYHLYKVDKFDFVICMSAFMGVAFISMDVGLGISVGLALIRALLYVARPNTTKLGNIPDSSLYRDTEQYPGSTEIPGVLIIQMGSPLYFANSNYIKDRISRWIRDEREISDSKGADLECIILDMGAVGTIDASGIETLSEIRKDMESSGIKVVLVNPRLDVLEKLIIAKFIDEIGKESVFLSIEDALTSCTFSLQTADEKHSSEV